MKEYDSRILSSVTTFNCCPRGALPCDLLQPIVHINRRHTKHTCKPRVSNRDSSMNFRRRGSMSIIPQTWFMYFSMFVGVNLCFYMKQYPLSLSFSSLLNCVISSSFDFLLLIYCLFLSLSLCSFLPLLSPRSSSGAPSLFLVQMRTQHHIYYFCMRHMPGVTYILHVNRYINLVNT